ncbi:MAG: DUF11 domain-containing protein [Frankiaceae bacterium]|nr:DUF11 domain-containing protein [Frankiaceae bacterium]
MNVLPQSLATGLRRRAARRGAALALAVAVVALFGGVPASAGGSGTVKVDGDDVGGPGNAPHQACGLQVSLYDFDAGAHNAVVTWTAKDTGLPIVTTPASGATNPYPFNASGNSELNISLPFALHTAGLTFHAGLGYHVTLDVSVDGVGKSKVIYVGACSTDVALSKTTSTPTVAVGDAVHYTLTVTNNGPLNGVGFQVTDTLPAGFTLTSITAPLWDCVGTGVDCTYKPSSPPVLVGSSTSFTVNGTATAAGIPSMTNNAHLDPQDTDNTNNAASVVVNVNGLATSQAVTFADSACVANQSTANTYTIPDPIPTGVVYKIGAATQTAGQHAASPGLLTVDVTAAPGYTLSGLAQYTHTFPAVATGCEAPTAAVTKANNANGDETFSISEEATSVSQPVQFKLTVTNTSPYAIDVNPSISDQVWVGAEPTEGPNPTSYNCLPAITNLAPTVSASCVFTADSYSPEDGVTKSNRATVTLTKFVPVDVDVPGLRRFRAAALVAPFTAVSNVSTVKTVKPVIRVVLPTPAAAVAPTASQSTCTNGTATTPSFTVPTTTGVVYTPATGGTATPGSTVTVTAAAAPGYVLSGPSSFPLVFAALADCSITDNVGVSKTGPGTAQPGDELVYAIDVTNVRGTPATAFTVVDTLPAGLSFSSAVGSGFACTNAAQVITCVYGGPALTVGQSATISVRALLDSTFSGTSVANTAVVDPGRADSDAGDNSATATTAVVPLPISGGGGGAVEEPAASPSPEPVAGGGGALPFTGIDGAQLLQLGVSLLLAGLFVSLATRRRRTSAE